MRLHRLQKSVVGVLALTLAGACSEQRANIAPPATATNSARLGHLSIRITVPKKRRSKHGRSLKYVSPATQSLTISIANSDSGEVVSSQTADLTPTSQGCESTLTTTVCTISSILLPPGLYLATLAAFAGTAGQGAVLSQGQEEPFTVEAGRANDISLSLYGVPASYVIATNSSAASGSASDGFTIGARGVWGNAQSFDVVALDAAGNLIVGPGAPTFVVTSSSNDFVPVQPTTQSPNAFSVTPPANSRGESAILTVQASSGDPTTCRQLDAACTTSASLTYAPFASDDWVTFAHDFQRTGVQSQATGLSSSTVTKLSVRWKTHFSSNFVASPVVYGGYVIVGDFGNIIALSAATGQTVWQRAVGYVYGTPTIDTVNGLVFVGQYNATPHNPTTGYAGPSTLYALNIKDGSIAWQHSFNGFFHSASVYANGMLYIGIAGGDSLDGCMNGGVVAFNAVTGQQQWEWYVNPLQNPGGGGGVWSPLAFDGSHVIFGTGNTCSATVAMQGAASLNLDGTMLWSYAVDTNPTHDNDTGGGVLVQNGNATFINKNGSLYTFNISTGSELSAIPLGATSTYGGFATPTSNGPITMVGAGFFAASDAERSYGGEACILPASREQAPQIGRRKPREEGVSNGRTSALTAVDNAGNIVWSDPMTAGITSYVAIDNGIGFAGLDSNLTALDISSGSILWQYRGEGDFHSGAAVVPSGVYAADYAGNVYALALPQNAR
jgi:hypothetical protein